MIFNKKLLPSFENIFWINNMRCSFMNCLYNFNNFNHIFSTDFTNSNRNSLLNNYQHTFINLKTFYKFLFL
jgi:hypothetical protein